MSETKLTDITIALIGNPNTGKSTLFSALCGVPARIGNYPGVTVEKKLGKYRDSLGCVTVIDLPGTYSLTARTPDEKISIDVLLGNQPDVLRIDAVVVVADATNLERNLYLFTQVRQLGLPLVLVLNLWDRAKTQIELKLPELQQRLGAKIVTTAAIRRDGIDDVRSAVREVLEQEVQPPPTIFPNEFETQRDELQQWFQQQGQSIPKFIIERLILDIGGVPAKQFSHNVDSAKLVERLESARAKLADLGHRAPAVETKSRYRWIREQLSDIHRRTDSKEHAFSDRVDRVLTHRVWGFAIFALMMFVVYQAITHGTNWIVESIDEKALPWVTSLFESTMPPSALRSLITDGVIAGVGSVLVFLPIILMLFFFIALLEDCGYMARAAFVMDKLMSKLGLSGKSFLPLMSSFACAIPGIMATRTIENRRDRMITILIAPLMSCSARLPVYMLMIAAFVPQTTWLGGWIGLHGLVLFAMSSLGLVVSIPVAWLLKRLWFRGDSSSFVMELPSYKLPSLRVVFFRVWERGQAFVTRAGTLIFCTTILVWAAGYFPGNRNELHELTARVESFEGEEDDLQLAELREQHNQLSASLIEQSFLGRVGKVIEPAVKPLGWDWRIGVGVLASFPAREVIIATLGTIYSLGGDTDEESEGLHAALHASKWPDGRPVFNVPVALSIMVFFALCAQCAATLVTIKRETNSWGWTVFTFAYMTALGYVGALITYQVASWVA